MYLHEREDVFRRGKHPKFSVGYVFFCNSNKFFFPAQTWMNENQQSFLLQTKKKCTSYLWAKETGNAASLEKRLRNTQKEGRCRFFYSNSFSFAWTLHCLTWLCSAIIFCYWLICCVSAWFLFSHSKSFRNSAINFKHQPPPPPLVLFVCLCESPNSKICVFFNTTPHHTKDHLNTTRCRSTKMTASCLFNFFF